MDWRRFAISLKGSFERARAWLVPLAHVCWMSVPVAMVAWGNHLALAVSIDFVAFRDWMRDTGKSAWWIVPFFILPAAIIILTNPESQNSTAVAALRAVAASLYFWGVIELSGLRRLAGGMVSSAAGRPTAPNPSPSRCD